MPTPILRVVCLVLLLTTPPAARAGNGMMPEAFGPRAPGMAGVDLAIATDTGAMNTNPAGITQSAMRVDVAFHGTYIPGTTFSDWVSFIDKRREINTNARSEPSFYPLVDAGFSMRVWDQLYAGIGFFVQGGMGAEYQGLKSLADPDPTKGNLVKDLQDVTYDARSQLQVFKLTPTLAYRLSLTDAIAVSWGVAANLGTASMVFEHSGFPLWEDDLDHMNAAHDVSFRSDYAFVWGLRAGMLLDVLDGLVGLGVVYSLESKLPLEGTTTIDGSATYDATVRDFSWPSEVGVGLSSRPLPGLLVGVDYRHIFWARAVDTLTVANTPRGAALPGYPGELDLPFVLSWRDQDVVAVGVEYTVLGVVPLRAGYNYARSAVGPEGINPLFTAIAEHNLAFGVGLRDVVPGLALDLAFAYTPETTVLSNTDNPQAHEPAKPGPGSQPYPNWYSQRVGLTGMVFHLGVGYEF